jgi:hypothetical protein
MSGVRVHRNSGKPAQLNALAYAQGSDIHLGSGQERHRAHEAWHVVQQMQGRVRPTLQLAGTAVNDDTQLEAEAEQMGAQAVTVAAAFRPGLTGSQVSEEKLKKTGNQTTPHARQDRMHTLATKAPTTQRAIGMEFECSNLSTTCSRKAEKGEAICGGYLWKMVYEPTAAGEPVAEFVVDPAANTELELLQAVNGIVKKARELAKAGTTTIGDFTIKAAGPADAAIQITVGTPLERVPEIMTSFRSDKQKHALERYREMEKNKVLTPDGTEFQALPAETRGFILLLMDYLRRGWVPEEYRPKKPLKNDGVPFVKAIFEMMARNDFTSIFKTLSNGEQDRLSQDGVKGKVLKDAWVRFIVDNAVTIVDKRSSNDVLGEPMINDKIASFDTVGAGPTRGEWLSDIPRKDRLTKQGFMGIGKMGDKMDQRKSDLQLAPLLEVRAPYSTSQTVDKWYELAEKAWASYVAAVGSSDVVRGN